MSSVVIWSQVWLFELSVEFLNANCKWQLAVGSGLSVVDHSDCSLLWVTFLYRNMGQRNLIGWIVPLLKSYWLKPQWLKTLLVGIPTNSEPSFSRKIDFLGEMFFWPCGHTSNQANNFSLQDSSLREREQQQVALVWGLAQLFLVEIVPLNYQQIIYFKWICYSRSSQPYPLLAALLREDDDHTYHTLHTDPRTREKRMHI